MMTKDEIKVAFDSFIEFPTGSDGLFVTTTSTLIFAEHVAGLVGAEIVRLETELLAATIRIDNDAVRMAEMTEQLDIQAGSIEAVQTANARLVEERDALKAELSSAKAWSRTLADAGDELRAELKECRTLLGEALQDTSNLSVTLDEVQTELAALRNRQPFAYIRKDQLRKALPGGFLCEVTSAHRPDCVGFYLAPGAQGEKT